MNTLLHKWIKHCINMRTYSTIMGSNNSGMLIGYIKRWLVLVLVIMQRYDPIGSLMVVKSIMGFGKSLEKKSEYFYHYGCKADCYFNIH